MTATMKAPAPKLTLRDTTDLEQLIDAWVEEHIDELELDGGALPDDLAQILDEVQASRTERADAIAFKLDRLLGDATTAKATKDRAARRERVANNLRAAIKTYAMREIERGGGQPIKGTACVLRIQKNGGKPAVDVRFENEQLLAFADASVPATPLEGGVMRYVQHPLARFIHIQRIAQVDTDALAVAYQARRTELEADVANLCADDIPQDEFDRIGSQNIVDVVADAATIVEAMRAKYIADNLAAEFPGVSVVRGFHLRVD